MNRKLWLLVISLIVTGATTLLEGLLGAALTPGPVAMLATAIAAGVVWKTHKPLVGLIIAGWLALGPIAMPWTGDQLSHPGHPAVFALTIVQLIANASAVIVGILAQVEYRHSRETVNP
jgi:hypothetical protein